MTWKNDSFQEISVLISLTHLCTFSDLNSKCKRQQVYEAETLKGIMVSGLTMCFQFLNLLYTVSVFWNAPFTSFPCLILSFLPSLYIHHNFAHRDFEPIAFTNRNIHSVVMICFIALLVLEVLVQSPSFMVPHPHPHEVRSQTRISFSDTCEKSWELDKTVSVRKENHDGFKTLNLSTKYRYLFYWTNTDIEITMCQTLTIDKQ